MRAALLIVLIATALSYAQIVVIPSALIDPSGRCEALNSSLCSDVPGLSPGSPIYVNNSSPQDALLTALSAELAQISLLSSFGYPQCGALVREYACLGLLRPCALYDTQTAAGIVALPAIPCYNSCIAMQETCRGPFTTLKQELPECPPQELVYDFSMSGGANVTANCTAFGDSSSPADQSCPLIVVFFGRAKAEQLRTLLIVFGYISLVECLLVLVLTAINPKLRKWPGGLVIIMAVGQSMLAFGCTIQSWASLKDLLCNTSTLYRGICRAQGFFIVVGLHFSISTWLLMTAVTTFLVWSPNPAAALRKTDKYKYYFALYYLVPLGFIIYAITDLGAIQATILCATQSLDTEEPGMVWPLIGEVFIGTCLFIASFVASIRAIGCGQHTKNIKLYVRLLCYEGTAIVPTCLFVIPIEIYRKQVRGNDPDFFRGEFLRITDLITVSAFLAPLLFGTFFLLRVEHVFFLKHGITTVTTNSSKSGGEARQSGSELRQSGGEGESRF